MKITVAVMQVAVIRPAIMFIAAVLWTNDSYLPGTVLLYLHFQRLVHWTVIISRQNATMAFGRM